MIVSRRVNLLLQAADAVAKRSGIDPERSACAIAESWRLARQESFRELAVLAGMRPPDEVVQRQFVEALEGRARRVAS